jgi:signal transduction histidine kinase
MEFNLDFLSKINKISKTLFNTQDPHLALDRALSLLGDSLQVDNIWLVKNSLNEKDNRIQLEPYHEWFLDESVGRIDFELLGKFTYEEVYGHYLATIAMGESLFGNSSSFSFQSKEIATFYLEQGMKSFNIVPIFYDSFHWGNLVLLDFHIERDWKVLNEGLSLLSSIFGSHIRNVEFRDSINEEYVSDHGKKMATLGEMAAGIVHEINNPLFIISGFATKINNLIERDNLDKHQLIHISEMIQKSCKRVTGIISGLRMISRKTKLDELEVKSFKDIIESTLDISRERIRLGEIELRVNYPKGEDFPVECHPEQLSQVLVNLFNNSYDSIVETDETKWIELSLKDLGDRFYFSVTDSGCSIPAEIAQKIMQPFFTTKESGKGTGLGLSISKEIVTKHGGNFYLDQNCSNARFVIELPKLEYE